LQRVELIAEKFGNALGATGVAYVPEGRIDPPSAHMRFPGTITVPDDVFEKLLESAAQSFKLHGSRYRRLSRGSASAPALVESTLPEMPPVVTARIYIARRAPSASVPQSAAHCRVSMCRITHRAMST